VGVRAEEIDVSTKDLVRTLESECGLLFEEPEFIPGSRSSVMRLKRRRAIHLECAKSSRSKKGESVNGDVVSFFENDEGHFYALIADGMGSGREAALASRLASVFLEKLLLCTSDKAVILDMLNRMLITGTSECFTTLDLAEIDLFEARASFIKAGAVPTYLLRDGKCYKIESATPPAGIITSLHAEETKTRLKGGDVIVMTSDGVSDGREPISVEELDAETMSASEMASSVLSGALSRFSARDDMSVAVVRVFEE
jgi:stage II sporulation protein E